MNKKGNKRLLRITSGLSEIEFKFLGAKANFEAFGIQNFYYNTKQELYLPNYKWK